MIEARLYWNGGAGDVIDYDTPIGTTSGTTFEPPPLATPSHNLFAVRLRDTVSGLEEQNVDALVRIDIDAAGVDVTGRPNPPSNLQARPTQGAGVRVEWGYIPHGQGGAPTAFRAWVQAGGSIDYGLAPAATVAYDRGRGEYAVDLPGLVHGTSYTVAVRATNGHGDETNTASVAVTADGAGPAAVEGFGAVAVAGAG